MSPTSLSRFTLSTVSLGKPQAANEMSSSLQVILDSFPGSGDSPGMMQGCNTQAIKLSHRPSQQLRLPLLRAGERQLMRLHIELNYA
ncbi:hypothetical protein SUGI_0495170 [Cryptomeria japonica]|nr:hypothetical protein SUGI_0495170 [Cryptomeria japonica]